MGQDGKIGESANPEVAVMQDRETVSAAEQAAFDAMLAQDLREERRLMRGELLVESPIAAGIA